MICGSSYNYNMLGFMNGTSFTPFYGSSTGFLGGCNPFMTSYAQPNFNAMAGWAVADSLLNMSTMLVGAAIQDRKDNSVENTQDDVIQLQKKVDAKFEELESAKDVLGSDDSNPKTGLYEDLAVVNKTLSENEDTYNNYKDTKPSDLTATQQEAIKAYQQALKDQKTILEKIEVQKAKVKKLESELKELQAQLKEADEKLDNQQLKKMLKRKTGTAYETVKNKFTENGYTQDADGDPVADLYGVLNAYRNDAREDQRETYAKQFLAIYDSVPAEDRGQFYSAYKLLKDNHKDIFSKNK